MTFPGRAWGIFYRFWPFFDVFWLIGKVPVRISLRKQVFFNLPGPRLRENGPAQLVGAESRAEHARLRFLGDSYDPPSFITVFEPICLLSIGCSPVIKQISMPFDFQTGTFPKNPFLGIFGHFCAFCASLRPLS